MAKALAFYLGPLEFNLKRGGDAESNCVVSRGDADLMLETAADRLAGPGGPHERAPDKRPARRLRTIEAAGRAGISEAGGSTGSGACAVGATSKGIGATAEEGIATAGPVGTGAPGGIGMTPDGRS